jgi:hypothetical protein
LLLRLPAPVARAVAALAAVAVVAGCQPSTSGLGSPSGGGSGGSTALQRSGGGLRVIHDPKQVTYSLHLATCHFGDGGQLPDPACTPGAVDPSVTQADIKSTICRSGGYTKKVRPSSGETDHAKFDVSYPAYGVRHSAKSEEDHLVSLELGGSNDIANLWPEVGKEPNPKDKVENDLHRAVCDGQVKLADAQEAIATDWETAESRLGLSG